MYKPRNAKTSREDLDHLLGLPLLVVKLNKELLMMMKNDINTSLFHTVDRTAHNSDVQNVFYNKTKSFYRWKMLTMKLR